jgi:hypothetical protein
MKFLALNSAAGGVVYIAVSAIGAVCPAVQRHAQSAGNAEILVQGDWLEVQHSPADVMRLMDEAP